VRNEEVLHRVKEEWNILHTKKVKANWIGHILRRNNLIKYTLEGKIEVMGRRENRCKQTLGDRTEMKGY